MKFKIEQIVLSNDDVERENRCHDSKVVKAWRKALEGDCSYGLLNAHYKYVADIEADNLEQVFHIGNMGPEEKITRHGRMHSLSVGDLVSNDDGCWMVAGIGFVDVDRTNT